MNEEDLDEAPIVPKTFDQLGILVLDGSGSMSEEALGKTTKAQSVSRAVRELFTRIKVSSMVANFSFGVITFDTKAKIHTPITPADQIDDNGDFDPTTGHGGGTDIAKGLTEARNLLDQFFSDGSELVKSAVIIVMTDGESKREEEALRLAEELKQMPNVVLCSAYFARKDESNQAAKDLLVQLASDPRNFTTVYDGQKLRDFFVASMKAGPQPKFREEEE